MLLTDMISMNFFRISRLILRIYSLVFTILWANMIVHIFLPETGITLYSISIGTVIGIVANIAFFLVTFQFKPPIQLLLGIILVPSIVFNAGLIHMQFTNVALSILWGVVLGGLTFGQFFNKEGIIYEKSG